MTPKRKEQLKCTIAAVITTAGLILAIMYPDHVGHGWMGRRPGYSRTWVSIALNYIVVAGLAAALWYCALGIFKGSQAAKHRKLARVFLVFPVLFLLGAVGDYIVRTKAAREGDVRFTEGGSLANLVAPLLFLAFVAIFFWPKRSRK